MPKDPVSKLPNTPVATPPPGYELSNLPSFIRPANVNTKVVAAPPKKASGGGNIIADVDYDKPQTIAVREPQSFTQPVQTHESTHVYQFSRNPQFLDNTPDVGKSTSTMYDYGGIEGLEQALKQNKTIANFDLEKQAQIVSDYQKLTANALKKGDRAALARVTAAYHPFIRQLSSIPAKGANMTKMTAQDLTPPAPSLPPATVVGVPMIADPLLGGEPVYPQRYTVNQLKEMASQHSPSATGQKVGSTKRFANGKIGIWDGNGWKAQH